MTRLSASKTFRLKMMRCLVLIVALMVVGCNGSDSCSACMGSNSTCRLVSGIFTRPQLPMGYNLITQIPQGVCNLTITELKQSRNYLAMRRSDGTFLLNGNWAINWSGAFEAGGTPFTYTRDDDQHIESIHSPGPLHEPLDLMVIYQQPNPGIKYQYQVPVVRAEHTAKESVIAPPLLRHPPAPKPVPEDHKPFDKRTTPVFPYGNTVPVGDPHAYAGDQAVKARPKRKRKFAWKITGFTDCSKSCGGGIQTAVISCVREHNQLTVTDRRCSNFEKPSPQTVRCNVKPCIAEWVGGEWSECSVTCGEGVQTREILCRQEITTTLIMTVADGACLTPPSPLLHRIRTCQQPACPQEVGAADDKANSQWQTGLWSECSVTCGLGVRLRSVGCPVGSCAPSNRPATESVCDMGPCHLPSATTTPHHDTSPATWYYTEWTQQCSEGCGTGVQTRKVYCSGGDYSQCPLDTQPDSSRACSSDKLCGTQWFTGPFGQCTVSCGWGRQSRSVICLAKSQGHLSILSEEHCLLAEKPAVEQPCQVEPCSAEWYTADWSQCSRSCDTGVQRREVRCLDEHQEPSEHCQEHTKPPTRRSCNTHKCEANGYDENGTPQVIMGDSHNPGDQPQHPPLDDPDCTDKYHNCHLVVQARLCKYKYYRSSCCRSCHNKL